MTHIQFLSRIEELRIQFRMIGADENQFDWAYQRTLEYAQTTTRPNSEFIIEKLELLKEMIICGVVHINDDWSAQLKIASQNG